MVFAAINGTIREYDNVSRYSNKANALSAAKRLRSFGDTTKIVKEGKHYLVYNRVAKKYGGMIGSKEARTRVRLI